MVVVPPCDNSLSFRFDVVSLLKTNLKSSSSSMFEDYFKDIMSPYFEFQKFNNCCRLIHFLIGVYKTLLSDSRRCENKDDSAPYRQMLKCLPM